MSDDADGAGCFVIILIGLIVWLSFPVEWFTNHKTIYTIMCSDETVLVKDCKKEHSSYVIFTFTAIPEKQTVLMQQKGYAPTSVGDKCSVSDKNNWICNTYDSDITMVDGKYKISGIKDGYFIVQKNKFMWYLSGPEKAFKEDWLK